jgi:hypothetical protein
MEGVALAGRGGTVSLTDLKRGAIALCSKGALGMITADAPELITYPDKSQDWSWTGVHLTDKIAPIGSPWSARKPKVVGNISELTQPEIYFAIAVSLGGWHVISAFTKQAECDRVRHWYEKLTNRQGEYQTMNIPFNLPIPPESEWPSIVKSSGRDKKPKTKKKS